MNNSNSNSKGVQKLGDILVRFNPLEDKYISREFQAYGYHLAEELNDMRHKSLYMKMAKNIPRIFLEKALSFVKDAKVSNKGALFMWKVKQLGGWEKDKKDTKKKNIKNKPANDLPF